VETTPSPPGLSTVERKGCQKAHGRSGVDRVYQELRELLEVRVSHGWDQLFDHEGSGAYCWLTTPHKLPAEASRGRPCRARTAVWAPRRADD
jgi:hypothetical protein